MESESKTRTSSLDEPDLKNFKKEKVDDEDDNDDCWLKEWTEESLNIKKDDVDDCWLKEWAAEPEQVKEESKLSPNYIQDDMENRNGNASSGLDKTSKTKSKGNQKCSRNPMTNRVNALIEKACHGAPESKKPINLCQFQCNHCQKILPTFSGIRQHYGKNHVGENICLEDVGEIIVSVSSYVCLICSSKTLCDTVFIRRHLKTHGYTVNQYVQKFQVDMSNEPPGTVYSENVIGNFCKYLCKNCEMEFTCRINFISHQRNRDCIFESHGVMVKKVQHRCKLCGKSVQCEVHSLKGHFKHMHNINIEEYCRRTGCTFDDSNSKHFSSTVLKSLKVSKKVGFLCIFKCEKCGKKFHQLHRYYEHIHKHHNNLSGSFVTSFHSGYSYKCTICHTLILCDKMVIKRHLMINHKEIYMKSTMTYNDYCKTFFKNIPVSSKVWPKSTVPVHKIPNKDITKNVGNLCQFKCLECDTRDFSSWTSLQFHYKRVHQKNIGYSSCYVTTGRYHACLLCPKAVLCDRIFLYRHLYTKGHKMMSLPEYEKIVRINKGKVLPILEEWKEQMESYDDDN